MSIDPFRGEVAEKFKQAIAGKRISRAQAARDLGISRQMLYEYLAGRSLPKHSVLERACTAWDLQLNYQGVLLTAKSFERAQSPRATSVPVQMDLFSAVDALSNKDLDVQILRKEQGRVELRVELRLGAAS